MNSRRNLCVEECDTYTGEDSIYNFYGDSELNICS